MFDEQFNKPDIIINVDIKYRKYRKIYKINFIMFNYLRNFLQKKLVINRNL